MTEPGARDEKSKEEILASIRRVVTERAEAPGEAGDREEAGILDLTQEIREDGSVVDIETGATVAGIGLDEPPDGLVGAEAETASAAAFASIAESAGEQQPPRESDGKTIEAAAKEVMLPMIREWLDANLSEIVERLVQREIERLSRRGESSADR